MKILIVGQTSSFWIKEYVVRALNPQKDEIYVLYDEHYGEDIKEEYEKKGVHFIITDQGVPILGRIPKIRTMVNLYYNMKKACKTKKFDIIEFQGMPVSKIIIFFEKVLFRFTNKVGCVYWGSDLLATPEKKVKYAKGCLKKSEYIVFDSYNLKVKFHEIFGSRYNNKIVDTRLGTTIFDDLDVVFNKKSQKECKAYFGFPVDAKVVAIGYNGRKRQQHMDVLKVLSAIDKSKMENVYLLLHLGYGLESIDYEKKIENYLNDNFENYLVIDKFLDKETTAMLRYAVDVFIHAQISDALAGSIKEYLYAGAVLINPEWIDYSECKEIGIGYLEYKAWEEIPNLLEKALRLNKDMLLSNREKLYNYFSWNALKPKWDMIHGKGVTDDRNSK